MKTTNSQIKRPNLLRNLQAAARRRGLSLRKHKVDDDGSYAFGLYRGLADTRGMGEFEDLAEVRDELHARPIESIGVSLHR